MSDHSSEVVDYAPCFDMEMFMSVSQETRMGGDVMARLMRLWETWIPSLTIKRLTVDDRQYLLVRLAPDIEEAVDNAWAASPAEGFKINALAQTLCMSAVHGMLPEIEEAGCAPSPLPSPALAAALHDEATPYKGTGPTLAVRYAVLTPFPFTGGCEKCSLLRDCPKGQGSGEPLSFTVPGHAPATA